MDKIIKFIKDKNLFLLGILLIVVIFELDIYTKRTAFSEVNEVYIKTVGIHDHIHITNYFNIVRVLNTGVSFGMFRNIPFGQYILSIITLLIIIFLVYLLFRTKSGYDSITYSIIIAGGLGNFYDRIIFGGVYDFLDFHISDYHWPAFNLADSMICIGVGLIILKDLINYFISKRSQVSNK